jgi:TusA-related sulfurtransferase
LSPVETKTPKTESDEMPKQNETTTAARWDAGEYGCSRLITELRRRLDRLRTGDRLEVIARDAGAPIDLWVWCRMTGNVLVSESHPHYVIEKLTG